jgi:PAS domain S-box-containing protein
LEAIPDAAFALDENGYLISMNAATVQITRFERAELLGKNIKDLLPEDSHDKLKKAIEGAASGGSSAVFPAHLITRDDRTVAVELRVTFHREAGEGLAVQIVAREAGLEKRLEAARRQETRFRLMANNLTEMVLAYDMDRRLTFANAATETLTGYSLAELERDQFICWVHPEDRDRMMRIWDRVFEGKSFHEEEYRMITCDGRMKWIAASWGPILDDSAKQVGVQGRERDITEQRMAEESRRQAEQHLRFNEQRYRALFEESPFPLWEEDFSSVKSYLEQIAASGVTNLRAYFAESRDSLKEAVRRIRILDVNRAAREFYRAETKEQLLGDLNQLFDAAAYDTFCEEIAILWETNSSFRVEFQTKTLVGEERTVSMIVSLASPADWSRVIVTFFDVTDRKHLEEQVLQSQKLESLGRLAGGVAHDFNNLLTVINGYCELVLQSAEEEQRENLEAIREAGARGAELTQQLLAFSRKQVAHFRPLNLNSIVQESEGMLRRVIGEHIRLVVSLDPAVGMVKADRGQLGQVLMNLAVNGRDAMMAGGTLTIETQSVYLNTQLREAPAAESDRPCVLLRVSDTGIGMDATTRERIFEPFFTTKRHGKTSGLGLATVFGIVSQAGGHIDVSSAPGEGSAFSVYLPCMAGAAMPDAVPERRMGTARASGTILVVEDQPQVRQLTCKMLRGMGYKVLEAGDGMQALETVRTHGRPISLLLTDVIMPGMNGREVAAHLKPLQPNMEVIFMSGYTDRIIGDVIDNSVKFLQKPFTTEQLQMMVRRALG